jgi:hypothetical protein
VKVLGEFIPGHDPNGPFERQEACLEAKECPVLNLQHPKIKGKAKKFYI